MTIRIQGVIFLPVERREWRDIHTRPATYGDEISEVITFTGDDDDHPTAILYRSPELPTVTLIRWKSGRGFTVKYDHDCMHAHIDVQSWDDAFNAAFSYAGWSNPKYAN